MCWSKSWRLTPRMKTRRPLISRSTPRTSTRRKPTGPWPARRPRRPGAGASTSSVVERSGASADHGSTSGTLERRTRPARRAAAPGGGRAPPSRRRRSATGGRSADGVAPHQVLLGRDRRQSGPAARGGTGPPQRRQQARDRRLDGPARLGVDAGERRRRPSAASVPVRQVVGRGRRWRRCRRGRCGSVAYRKTERVIPPCHHWSWSSMYVASDHLTTVSRSVVRRRPARWSVMSNSAARCESLLIPTSTPLSAHEQDALGGPDVEHDPAARPVGRDLERSARRCPSGSRAGRSGGTPGTASGRSCTAARPRCPGGSSSPGRRSPATRPPRGPPSGSRAAGSATCRRATVARDAGRRASEDDRATRARDWSRDGSRPALSHPLGGLSGRAATRCGERPTTQRSYVSRGSKRCDQPPPAYRMLAYRCRPTATMMPR